MLVRLVVFLFVTWLLILKWRRRHLDKLYEQLKITAPRLPFIGHLYLLLNQKEIMKNIESQGRDASKAGGVAGFWFAHKLYIHITDPTVAEIVLRKCLEKADIMKCFHIATGDGSIFTSVKTWRPRRKLLNPTFNMVNLKSFVKIFSEQSDVLVEELQKNLIKNKKPFSISKNYLLYSMDSIMETLGIQVNAQKNHHHPFLVATEEIVNAATYRLFRPWLYSDFVYKLMPWYRKLVKHRPIVFGFIDKIIEEKEELFKNNQVEFNQDNRLKTFVDLMLESECVVNKVAIREECIIIMSAASETTAVNLGYASILLARYPDMQEKVYNEVKEVIGDVKRPVTQEDLPHLKYLEAFIRETLRLYPTVPIIARKIEKNIELPSGVTLLPGCGAAINIWAINRNPAYWGEDAEEFRPERFLDSTPRHPAAFASFSLGPRNCIGYQYAMMSMKTVLATVLQQFRFVPASDDLKHKPLRTYFDILMKHVDNYCVGIEARK